MPVNPVSSNANSAGSDTTAEGRATDPPCVELPAAAKTAIADNAKNIAAALILFIVFALAELIGYGISRRPSTTQGLRRG